MCRAHFRNASTLSGHLILSLGLMLSALMPVRGDDGKDQAKKKAAAPAPAATKSESQKAPAEQGKGKAGTSSPAPAAPPVAKPARSRQPVSPPREAGLPTRGEAGLPRAHREAGQLHP